MRIRVLPPLIPSSLPPFLPFCAVLYSSTRNFLTFVNTTAIAYGQKICRSLRILVVCNSSCVHKRQKITSILRLFPHANPIRTRGCLRIVDPDYLHGWLQVPNPASQANSGLFRFIPFHSPIILYHIIVIIIILLRRRSSVCLFPNFLKKEKKIPTPR
ncbi:hypothetical protein HOY82DRAFT_383988 [Tuber indicum]|nr:hypothetical protein HOY82DRAFT_383988 [Tuber indicum]